MLSRLTLVRLMVVTATWACTTACGLLHSQAAEAFCEAEIPLFANNPRHMYRLPSLIVTSKGTVLAACKKEIGTTDSDFAPTSLVLRRSEDGGATFGREQTLYFHEGDVTFNGNLIEDRQTGTIFACFIRFPYAERKTWFETTWITRGGGFSLVKSTDDGKTWSDPIDVLPTPNADGWLGSGAYNSNHGVQLQHGPHTGRLLIAARVLKKGVYEKRGKGGLIYSDDHGHSWRVGGVVLAKLGSYNGEVSVGETADGEVYVNSRNQTSKSPALMRSFQRRGKLGGGIVPHRRIYSRSKDGGETLYTEGCHDELFDPPCNASQTSYPAMLTPGRNVLLHTKPGSNRPNDRSTLTCYLSYDGGRHWTTGQVVSEKSGGYSDVAVTPDGTIVTVYENRSDPAVAQGILIARYNLPWLLGGNQGESVPGR